MPTQRSADRGSCERCAPQGDTLTLSYVFPCVQRGARVLDRARCGPNHRLLPTSRTSQNPWLRPSL